MPFCKLHQHAFINVCSFCATFEQTKARVERNYNPANEFDVHLFIGLVNIVDMVIDEANAGGRHLEYGFAGV